MSMSAQLLLVWGMAVVVPLLVVLYVELRFRQKERDTKSLFDIIYSELEKCHEREKGLSARISELERQIGSASR